LPEKANATHVADGDHPTRYNAGAALSGHIGQALHRVGQLMDDIQLVYESHEPAALTSIGLSASQVGSRIAILGRQDFFNL